MPAQLCPACLSESGRNSHSCPSCGADLPVDPPRATGHACPVCGPDTLLYGRRLGSLDIEACDACVGLFLSRDAVLRAHSDLGASQGATAQAAPSTPDPVVRYRSCPTCGKLMQRKLLGAETGVVLDVCSAHGTWFDRGELERAVQFARSGGLDRHARTDAERDLARARAERLAARPGTRLGTHPLEWWQYALFDVLESVTWLWP